MGLHIGDTAPDFSSDISTGPNSPTGGSLRQASCQTTGSVNQWAAESLNSIDDVNGMQNTTVAAPDSTVAGLYNMLRDHESTTAAVRSVFIIDPERKIRMSITYPMNVGRNFNEILRVINALQTDDATIVTTSADWTPGDQVIIQTSINTKEAEKMFPQGWTEVHPYLCLTTL